MLRITIHDAPPTLTLRIEGRLAGPWVGELAECWRGPRPSRHQPDPLGEQGRGSRAGMPLPGAGCEVAFCKVARGWSGGHGDRERPRRLLENNQPNVDRRTIS
jgi:hypothetical protein